MINPSLYKNSRVYDFFMKLLGYESSLDRFIRQLPLDIDGSCKILDAGCGTGLLGLALLERMPSSTLIATDLEPNFLKEVQKNAKSRGIEPGRVRVGQSNISQPQQFTNEDSQVETIHEGSMNVVCVGAVVGYADNIEESLRSLVRLLAPGGMLINIEMNESIVGRYVSKRYHYHNISVLRMLEVLREAGCQAENHPLKLRFLPAKFTRTAVIAKKASS
jgi:ubiquinone/menaquinone biosynthesis C-methylase UbiE